MNKLEKQIHSAEKKWLDTLYAFCKKKFADKKIISHDHTHHLRVWEYSKEILSALNESFEINYDLVEACLIASLFHDTGLTKVLGEEHGFESKKFCEMYFELNTIERPAYFNEILYAIEKHDDKDYKENNNTPNSLLSILCNADDLDAFGNIGIVRYTEIYLLRGKNLNKLPGLVITNLYKRFSNFENSYKSFSELYNKHKARYLITRKFFEDLQKESLEKI